MESKIIIDEFCDLYEYFGIEFGAEMKIKKVKKDYDSFYGFVNLNTIEWVTAPVLVIDGEKFPLDEAARALLMLKIEEFYMRTLND